MLLFFDFADPLESILVAFGILTPLVVGYLLGYLMCKGAEKRKYEESKQ